MSDHPHVPFPGAPPDRPQDVAPRGWARIGILQPLKDRDFALLWLGLTISLCGNGLYFVAIAWQVYDLSNTPTALSLVGVAWTLPLVLFVLVGGVVTDRFERRRVMIFSDIVRGVAIAAIGVLSVTGTIELWHLYGLVAVFGVGEAFFAPAFNAIVPEVVPAHLLMQANALDNFVKPFTLRFVGPALGGVIVAVLGPGQAFLIDAGTFAFSALMLMLMRYRPPAGLPRTGRSARVEVSEGFKYVRSQPWLWATLLSAAVGLLAFFGPMEVLIPFLVRNKLGGDAGDLGLVFGAGGVGAVVVAAVMGQWGFPRRHITFMYASWSLGTVFLAGFALAAHPWQAMITSFFVTGLFTAGSIVWVTMLHKLVPGGLLGRVSSFDWLVSVGLVPASFALTGPIAEAIGAEATLIWAGLIGGAVMVVFLLWPGVRDTERDGSLEAVDYRPKELQTR